MIGIYKITNSLTGKHYIGQSNNIERRLAEHKRGTQLIDKEIQRLGEENFTFEIIEECSLSDLNEREEYWIAYYNSFYDGYNATKGGHYVYNGNPKITADDVRKIREAYAQRKDREEVYQAYSDRLSRGGFYHVWDGSRWKEIMPEVYSEENKKWHANKTRFQCGENHNASKLTDEEVLNIRRRYVNETAESIWQDYKDKYTLGSFKQILGGTKYSHLPIYKKTRKEWI